MSCCTPSEELSAYVDGEVAQPRRKVIEAHLKQCAPCAELERSFRLTSRLLAAIPPESPARSLVWEHIGEHPPVGLPALRCTCVLPQASALLDGELGADEADAVSAHLYACPQCYKAFRRMEDVVDALQAQPPVPSPEGLTERIMAGLDRVDRPTVRDRLQAWRDVLVRPVVWRFVGASALAAAAGLLLVVCWPVWRATLSPEVAYLPLPAASAQAELRGPTTGAAPDGGTTGAPWGTVIVRSRSQTPSPAGGFAPESPEPAGASASRQAGSRPAQGQAPSGVRATTAEPEPPAPHLPSTGLEEVVAARLPVTSAPDALDVTAEAPPPLGAQPPPAAEVLPAPDSSPLSPASAAPPGRSLAVLEPATDPGRPDGPASARPGPRTFASHPEPPPTTYVPSRGGYHLPTTDYAVSNPGTRALQDDLHGTVERAKYLAPSGAEPQ